VAALGAAFGRQGWNPRPPAQHRRQPREGGGRNGQHGGRRRPRCLDPHTL
jgi:hypothetical protein